MAPPARVDELKKRYEENPRRFFAPLANEYRKAGDLEAAIDLCRMHLEEQPGHLSGHIVYGQALFESSRADDAKSVFEAALTLDPENLIALRHLGDIARAGGDATAAKHWYGRVLEADPRNDEIIALIDALGQAGPQPTVVLAEQHELPPAPNYGVDRDVAPAIDPSAPTPAVPIAAVPPTPAVPEPRPSIGLMDLDLNLADSTAPAADLLGDVPAEPINVLGELPSELPGELPGELPVEPLAEAPVMAEAPPAVHEPAPAVDDSFASVDHSSSVLEVEAPDVPGVGDMSLGATVPGEPPVEVLDTSFGAPPPEEESMFAAAHVEPEFGDSLDITASVDFEAPPPTLSGPLDGLAMVEVGDTVPIGEPVTDAKPTHAAPATPADFDALFGAAPIADVHVGGDESPALEEEAGFHADSFVGREPADEVLAAAPDIATPPSPFVTETMAELYLQQGFREEALSVYRQLLAQDPDDKGLAERVMHLEHGTRSSLAIDAVSEEIEAAELRKSGSIPTVPAEPVTAPMAPPPEPEPAMEPMPAPEPATPAVVAPIPAAAGPLARDILSRIASRRALPGGGLAAATAVPAEAAEPTALDAAAADFTELTPVDAFAASSVSPAPAPAAATVPTAAAPEGSISVAPGGAVDRLFGMSGVVAVDENAAIAMATALGAAPHVAPIRGEPTRKGTDELSLDSVFGSNTPTRPSMVQRQSSTLRFDQFFSGAEGGASAPATPSPSAAPDASDDIAQFSHWLKGLKGS